MCDTFPNVIIYLIFHTLQRSHQPGGAVVEGKRGIDETGEPMVVRQNRMQARGQTGCFQKRIIPEQRSRDILHPHRWPAFSTGRRAARILLQITHGSYQSEGNELVPLPNRIS